jgi:hypothetical protein
MTGNKEESPPKASPGQVTEDEALRRMRSFKERKEKFVAAIKKSKDRDIYSGTRDK